jgi:hypothetical protein
MKKAAVAAAALVGITAFSGASVAPAATPSPAGKATHTIRWMATETASHSLPKNSFVGSDVIRSVRTGKVVGYDCVTGVFFPTTNGARIQFAASVKGGILVGQVHGRFTSNNVVLHGRILRGTGKFAGATGTVTAQPRGSNGQRTLLVIHYTV